MPCCCQGLYIADPKETQSKKKRLHMLDILLSNRLNADVLHNLPVAKVHPDAQKRILDRLEMSKNRMKKWSVLTDIANRNRLPGLTAGTYECFYKGQVMPVAAVGAEAVEFMLPPYFYEEKISNPSAHARICSLLRNMLDVFRRPGLCNCPPAPVPFE
jgi:hypothetical protein